MATERCPRCGGSDLVAGTSAGPEGDVWFNPSGLRQWSWSFTLRPGVRLQSSACLSCGFVWVYTSPEQLRAFIEKHGTEEAKAELRSLKKPEPDSPPV